MSRPGEPVFRNEAAAPAEVELVADPAQHRPAETFGVLREEDGGYLRTVE
jgi:hypothetical protein